MLEPADVALLRCPACRATLAEGPGRLDCAGCGARWPVEDRLARLYRESEVRGTDRFLRAIYDRAASLHDPAVRLLLPLFQSGTEESLREHIVARLELGDLAPGARVLEVGVGTGANLHRVRRALPAGAVFWGVDLSAGMLAVCRRRLDRDGSAGVRLAMADAHALPFPDGAFDRVFHVGAANSFRDPARALAEMARVARPGTPIVVVDEQLDPAARNRLWHRLAFRLVTFYDRDPRCPRDLLPPGATGIVEEQPSRFFYCLTFRVG